MDIVRWLVEEKEMDVNVKDNDGLTALHNAAREGRLEIVRWLVEERGWDVNFRQYI